jgi:AraC family transcriptional regulator
MRPPTSSVGDPRPAGPFLVRRIDYPPGLRQTTHYHDRSSLTILLAGEIRESARSREVTGSALSVVVKPAGTRHADEVGPRGARTLQVTFDPADAAALDGGSAVLCGWQWLHASPATAPLVALARLLADDARAGERAAGRSGEREPPSHVCDATREERVIEAVAALGRPDTTRREPVPDWLVRVREALDEELETGVDVRELARRVGAHPVSVSRAFRRHYGRTISDYRRRERVRRAAERLAESSSSITRIAHGTGHADHPHLCREFRRATGLSPSAFRRLAG